MLEKWQSLKNRGLVPTIQPEPETFQKLLVTGCRDIDKKHQKYPQNGGSLVVLLSKLTPFKNDPCHDNNMIVQKSSALDEIFNQMQT